jgi:hypothetical protein
MESARLQNLQYARIVRLIAAHDDRCFITFVHWLSWSAPGSGQAKRYLLD